MSWPAPEVASRPATPEEIPSGARRLSQLIESRGWDSRCTYARGTLPDRNGEPGRVVDSVVVRGRSSGVQVAACWIDGKFFRGWWLPLGRAIPVRLGLRDLTTRIRGTG